jgi:DNA-binding NtrC family response regulator
MSTASEPRASILIVDDNVGLDRTLAFILDRKGYEVATAATGPDAIEQVRERPFDMIFLDIQMPMMNGTETYKKIVEIRPGAAVVMMTAYAVEDLVQEALDAGARGILHKPLDVDKLVALVEEARNDRNGGLILVVDDDESTCATLKNILARQHLEVCVAHTGEEAIENAKVKGHDIILIDMHLPTINGLETYLAIKKVNPEAVAIMMTAYREEMQHLVTEALNHDAYACIYKPIDMGRLLPLIEEIRSQQRAAREGAAP